MLNKIKLILFVFYASSLFAKAPILIYYGDKASNEYLNHFKVVVLDPEHFNNVFNLKSVKFGYLSIGEVQKNRSYFNFVKKLGILKGENPNWRGSFYVNLISGKWQEFVINYLIPSITSKGYNGIFLDTVDSLLANNYKNLVIKFINSIKRRYPALKIFMNRGLGIVNKVNVDAVLLESTITSYNFKKKKYYFFKNVAKFKIPENIEIYSVDYWCLNDYQSIKRIYKKALKFGYKPLVTDISLYKLPALIYDEDAKKFILLSEN